MCRNITLLILISILTLGVQSCENENKGYEEYYHPMGNNPTRVVPWLSELRESFYKNEARISMYELEEIKYYTAQLYIPTDSLMVSPFTIYESDSKQKIVYFHTDDVLLAEQDTNYMHFIENADLINVLWSNEKKYSTVE